METLARRRVPERWAAAMALALALAVPGACDGPAGGSGKVGGRDYSFAAGKVALPEDFPGDVPLPEDRRLLLVRRFDDVGTTVIISTAVPVGEAEGFYRLHLERRGWQFKSEGGIEGQRFLGYEKDERALSVVIAPEGEVTVVSLSLAPAVRY